MLPPPISETLASELYKYISNEINKQHSALDNEIKSSAKKCLFYLSASNFSLVAKNIIPNLNSQNLTEEEIQTTISLLEYLNHNEKSLGMMIQMIGKALNGLKKSNIQILMAKILRTIIWSWIDNFPFQFISLCQSGRRMSGNPDTVFDIFDGWASNTAKKLHFWPVCTMLLVLCPDIMLAIVGNDDKKKKEYSSKSKFLEGLRSGLKSSKLTDISVRCYVDICTASTFVSKSDISALRYIAPAVEADLVERLFNQSQPFKRSDGTVDENLMVDCLKAMFYLSPRKVINSIFGDCLKSTSTQLLKRVFVDTLLAIVSEKKKLEWNPTLADIYSNDSSLIRQLFDDLLGSVRDYESLQKNANDKKGKIAFEKVLIDIEILKKIIKLYKCDPAIALHVTDEKQNEEIRRLLTGLSDCSIFFDLQELSKLSSETLITLHESENIERWFNGADDFWSTTSSVNLILASIIIERSDLSSETILNSLTVLEKVLLLRNEFINIRTDVYPTSSSKHIRLFASTNIESAFLIHLGNSDTQIVSKCSNVCRLLCSEIQTLRHCIDESDNSILVNFESYLQLASSSLLSTGRQAQQKSIRTILKKVDHRTPGNFVAWDEICYRWNIYTQIVKYNEELALKKDEINNQSSSSSSKSKKKQQDQNLNLLVQTFGDLNNVSGLYKILLEQKSSSDVLSEWNNYTGVLLSLNAVTTNESSGRAIGARQSKTELSSKPESFLNELMDLLVSEYVSIRETVKMMLGNAISPSIYSILFKILYTESKKRIFSIEDQSADFSNNSILFADQVISIVKLILDSENDSESLSLITGFEELILLLIRYVRQLTLNVNNLQIRHKLCGLLDSMMLKSNLLSFRNSNEFRIEIVENIMEWTSEFSTKESNIPSDLQSNTLRQIQKIIKELDVQVMESISSLLKGLPLQGKDDDAKSSEFSKFFNFFTKFLTRCKKNPQSVLTPQLPDATIEALSFLVTANIEHGIEYFLSMGYYEDYESRSAFLRVLTNILSEGTDFESELLSFDKYYKLLELILDSKMDVVLTLGDVTPITEADKVASLLVSIFEANDKAIDLLKASILTEVNKTESANTLFRLNSMATKLLSAYCKLIGKDYLQISVGNQIKNQIQNPKSCELDPSRLKENENLKENEKNLLEIAQSFLEDIELSIPKCPNQIREICKFLHDTVCSKFPEAGNTAIAGFIFLRYLCPAIVAPDGFGIVDNPIKDTSIRRSFVLITKLLQNLANRVKFGGKEEFMSSMNTFIESNIKLMEKLFSEYASTPFKDNNSSIEINSSSSSSNTNSKESSPIEFTEENKEEDLGRLHYYLNASIDKLGKAWSAPEYNGINYFDKLTAILAQLGTPPELPKASITRATTTIGSKSGKANIHYEKFMNRMSKSDTSSIKDTGIYYQNGKTEKGNPVFYYIARYWNSNIDMDLFNYYMLSSTQQYFSKPYSIVIDLTFFSNENQIPLPWCSNLYSVLPSGSSDNLESIFILYPNSIFKKYSKRIGKLLSRITKKLIFCSSLNQLSKYINYENISLPQDTLSIEKTIQSTFSKVIMTKIGQYNKKEVKLIMSAEVLQIIPSKQHPILNHNVTIIDMVPVSRITNISTKEKNDFTLSYNINGIRTFNISSNSSDQIIQQLTSLKDRQDLSKSNQTTRAKTFQPSNVPGTMLNMAFLNMTVKNYPLRVAAYNLLVTLCSTFAFNIESSLFESYNIAIPNNAKHFIVRVSEELSKSEPRMTLEFLQQAFEAISNGDKSSRIIVLDYIKPWLINLEDAVRPGSKTYSIENLPKVSDILNLLMVLTIRESKDIGPAILGKVWMVLASCPSMIDLIIKCLLDRTSSGSGTSQLGEKSMDAAEDILVSIASVNPSFITGKIINLFLKLLTNNYSSININIDDSIGLKLSNDINDIITAKRLENLSIWVKFEVLIRFLLTLSFENLICVEIYLPEIFFIIISTFYSGDSLIRSNVYTLFLNTVHSVISSTIVYPDKLQTLRFLFIELQQLANRIHFGVGADVTPYKLRIDRDNNLATLPIGIVENVANSIFSVLNCCSPGSNCIGTIQHSRFLSLISNAAFKKNFSIQPRAITTLGIICRHESIVTDDLISKLLSLLKDSFLDSSVSFF